MKIRFYVALVVTAVLLLGQRQATADSLHWDIPGGIGTVGLPFESTEVLMGYDVILNKGIGGASVPVLSLFTGKPYQLDGQLGAVGAFPTQAANVQPYLALGHDVARDIPGLAQFKSLHLNGFGRYATDLGKFGAGVSASYSFN